MRTENISKILVGVDGSKCSMDALDYAIKIAKKEESVSIIALYVIPSNTIYSNPTFFYAGMPLVHKNIIEGIKKDAQEWLNKIEKRNENDKISIQTKIISGLSTVGELVEFADREDVDLIIVGTRGNTGFKKLLIGSTAQGVVTYAHCPVLVVK
ncbi:MAG: universal stress protein [Nitrososphaeraceae archaeon]